MSKIAQYYKKSKKIILLTMITTAIVTTVAFASVSNGQNLYVNGTEIQNVEIYTDSNCTFVPATDIAKAFGDTVTETETRLTITHKDKTLVFKAGQTIYTVNNKIKNIAVKEVNGVKIPSSTAETRSIYGKVYVPIEILKSELGYDISTDSNSIWVGNKPANLPQASSSNSTQTTVKDTNNMHLSLDNGWVCPQLTTTSVDDVQADATTLINQLEFTQNGATSAKFDPINGEASFVTVSVGPTVSTEYSSIIFKGYHFSGADGYMQKVNQINPQVLKFYFPTSWEWINNQFLTGNNLNGTRQIIDGRDTYIQATIGGIEIHFSKVGETLGY